MLREDLAATLRAEHETNGYLFPAYDDYCFARIPATVQSVFGIDNVRRLPPDVFATAPTRVRNVAVVFVDGLGFDRWRADHADHEFFDRVTESGVVTPLTSTFPSETAACVTTMHTGLFPAEHGLLGWHQYLPEIDRVVETLPFRTYDGAVPTTPDGSPANADLLFEGDPQFGRLAEAGVESVVLGPGEMNESRYSQQVMGEAKWRSYPEDDFGAFARRFREAVEADGQRYVYGYLPQIDAVAHREGTESAAVQETLADLSDALVSEFLADLDPRVAEETLVLVVSDHGQRNLAPDENLNLSQYDVVADAVRRDRAGDPLAVGGPRSLRLHLREGTRDRVTSLLRAELDALVLPAEEAIDRGLFGPGDPIDDLRARVGDLVIVPKERGVWLGEHDRALQYVGMHGGFHPDEMLVPFAAAGAADLR